MAAGFGLTQKPGTAPHSISRFLPMLAALRHHSNWSFSSAKGTDGSCCLATPVRTVSKEVRTHMSDNKERLIILVVDDETRDRKSLCHVLTQEGHVVLEAADYWEAVQVHRQHEGEINLLVTAIALPGTNGYELAKTLFRID